MRDIDCLGPALERWLGWEPDAAKRYDEGLRR